jgi:hypothetical protein
LFKNRSTSIVGAFNLLRRRCAAATTAAGRGRTRIPRKDPSAIDQRFIEYLLALTDGVTGRIVDLLRRAAIGALTQKSKSVGIVHLLVVGANLPAIINQRADFPI